MYPFKELYFEIAPKFGGNVGEHTYNNMHVILLVYPVDHKVELFKPVKNKLQTKSYISEKSYDYIFPKY